MNSDWDDSLIDDFDDSEEITIVKTSQKKNNKKKKEPKEIINKIVQVHGIIVPISRHQDGSIERLGIKEDGKITYEIQMDNMGKKISEYIFQDLMIRGKIIGKPSELPVITIQNYI